MVLEIFQCIVYSFFAKYFCSWKYCLIVVELCLSGETPTRRSSRISSRTPPSFETPQRGSAKKRSSINALSSEGGSSQKRSRKKASEKDEPESIEPQPSIEKDGVGAIKDNEEILIARVTKEDEEIQGQVQLQGGKMEDVGKEEVLKNA